MTSAPDGNRITHNATVLIIDDTPTSIAELIEYLNTLDMTVLVTRDGESGVRLAAQQRPDVVLLEVMMPAMDGFDTCRQLKARESTRAIPVLFMSALTDTANRLLGFEAGAADYITKPVEQQEVVARINAHLTSARQHQRMLRLFSILAHDLRSPFSSLMHLTKAVSDNAAVWQTDELVDRANAIHQTCSNIYRLTENLLSWAQLQQHRETVNPQSVSLCEAVMETLVVCSDHAEEKAISVSYSVQPELEAYCDRNMLLAVLRNLVTNALKFTHKCGSVHISAEASPRTANGRATALQCVRLRVKDNGIGIPTAVLPHLFRMDSKVQTTGTNHENGTGLGLILCREMLAKNNGALSIVSREGKGTTITVDLPREPLSDHNQLSRSIL